MTTGIIIANISIELAGITLCVIGILQVLVGARVSRKTAVYFILFFAGLIVYASANLICRLLAGHPGDGYRAGLLIGNYCEYLFACTLPLVGSLYLLDIIDPKQQMRIRPLIWGLFALHVLLLTVSQFTGLYYTYDADNLYHRSAGHPLSFVIILAMMAIDLVLMIRYRSRMSRREQIAFWVYMAVPLVAIVLQILIYGIYFIMFASVIAASTMYICIVADQTERFYEQERENNQLKVDIMLSQIQPHFLYNSLSVIRAVCRIDAKAAEEAIGEFTAFLRHNMDSLSMDRPIPFRRELEHVERYISLQRLRFEDDLNIRYELDYMDFNLPTLTLQPLVENAVRYGVRDSEDGRGTITIQSLQEGGDAVIRVIDDGPGFDTEMLEEDSSRHIGLRNVRNRLAHICGGTLTVDSVIGQGTTVTMRVPVGADEV